MKKLFFFFIIALTLTAPIITRSQEKKVKLDWAALSSGEGALSSGLFFETEFLRGEDVIGLYLGKEDLATYYLKAFLNSKIKAGPCLEYFHNSPTLGGMVLLLPVKNVSALTWSGITAGQYGQKVELTNWQFLFLWQQVNYCYKRFTASGIVLLFDEVWHPILDFKYKQPLDKEFCLFTSAGYDFSGEGKSLLKLGIMYTPKKK